ncbi:MAG: type II toxin-antitoxin system RelE/ParE family toxin [Bryobacterales bacterium]|nr:type II toxin-antitoxin system RelE/ParE family toxin [Bryobacterales bacterium]
MFRVSKDAEGDLEEIFLYWAQRTSLRVADRIIDGIADRFSLLGEHPNAGRSTEDIGAGVRCFPAGKYLIYYRKARGRTEILHLFHGARNQSRALRAKKCE